MKCGFLQKHEAWEDEKTEADMEKYVWEMSKSKGNMVKLLQTIKDIDKVSMCMFGMLQTLAVQNVECSGTFDPHPTYTHTHTHTHTQTTRKLYL